jgi:tetratricopeptide (TPR) repeat protein
LKTKCNIGNLQSLQYILFNTRQEHLSIYIDGFQPPGKAIKPRPAKYPGAKRDLHAGNKTNREGFSFSKWMGYRGYVIVNFSIDEEGRTFNQALKESSFGSSSGGFNDNAIAASKSLVFPPAKYLNKPISINNYSFKYRFEDGKENMLLWGDDLKVFNKLNTLIKKNKLNEALDLGIEKLYGTEPTESADYFHFQLAKIYFLQGNFSKAIEYSNKYLDVEGGYSSGDSESFVLALSILIESYFKEQRNIDLISRSEKLKELTFRGDKPKYKKDLAQSNLYLGLTYLFEGQIIKGIEHLVTARRSSENPQMIQIVDLYLEKAEKAI